MEKEKELRDNSQQKNPTDDNSGQTSDELPTLSDLFIGFQKSMARVAQATAKATKEDPLFLYGRRNLYYIDEVDIETVVRIMPEEDAKTNGKKHFERIRVLTKDTIMPSGGEPSAGWTKLKFKLIGRSLDVLLDRPGIFIRVDQYRKRQRDYLIELQVIKADGTPGVCENITVEVLPDADESKKKVLKVLNTNELGIINLRLLFKSDPKKKAGNFVILSAGKLESPKIAYAETYLLRAQVSGENMKPPVEDIELITTHVPLFIKRSEFEED